ncbi:hypothetical protein [Thiocapsa marina]|uniref:Uncharacterized protein n=1 Tax=Thiocapsa marina 5811 TaxID=768671 RepID=F9UAN8_9GAMM|nr:hypothetical protein [Thiocapsa marina]EGV18790.1 hypothetical protein ThimaDRAFT_2208 [Thiocapsa marina 5811]
MWKYPVNRVTIELENFAGMDQLITALTKDPVVGKGFMDAVCDQLILSGMMIWKSDTDEHIWIDERPDIVDLHLTLPLHIDQSFGSVMPHAELFDSSWTESVADTDMR